MTVSKNHLLNWREMRIQLPNIMPRPLSQEMKDSILCWQTETLASNNETIKYIAKTYGRNISKRTLQRYKQEKKAAESYDVYEASMELFGTSSTECSSRRSAAHDRPSILESPPSAVVIPESPLGRKDVGLEEIIQKDWKTWAKRQFTVHPAYELLPGRSAAAGSLVFFTNAKGDKKRVYIPYGPTVIGRARDQALIRMTKKDRPLRISIAEASGRNTTRSRTAFRRLVFSTNGHGDSVVRKQSADEHVQHNSRCAPLCADHTMIVVNANNSACAYIMLLNYCACRQTRGYFAHRRGTCHQELKYNVLTPLRHLDRVQLNYVTFQWQCK